jgi:hypothetical protein
VSSNSKWVNPWPEREFDLAFACYDLLPLKPTNADYIFLSNLEKFRGAYELMGEKLLAYKAVAFLDDDVEVDASRIMDIFHEGLERGYAVWQPALTPESVYCWSCTAQHPGAQASPAYFVEVMCPFFSREGLEKTLPIFTENYGGCGLDVLWSNMFPLEKKGMLHHLSAGHYRPICSAQRKMPNGLTKAQESRQTIAKHGLQAFERDLARLYGRKGGTSNLHIVGSIDNSDRRWPAWTWDQVKVWHKSIRTNAPGASISIVGYGLSPQFQRMLASQGVRVIFGRAEGPHCVVKRFGDYAKYLQQLEGYAILSDISDVVFQANPEPHLRRLLQNHDILVQEEPHSFRHGLVCLKDNLETVFPVAAKSMLDHNVVCAGVVAGKTKELSRFCASLHSMCLVTPKDPQGCVLGNDQATLNVLCRPQIQGAFRIKIQPPMDSWCYHALLELNQQEMFSRINPGIHSSVKDGVVLNPDGVPYTVVHLYKYSKEWTRIIQERFR